MQDTLINAVGYNNESQEARRKEESSATDQEH